MDSMPAYQYRYINVNSVTVGVVLTGS